jgi:hypothetical protein
VGLKFAKRAIKSLRILKDQNFTLILPVCFDPVGKERDSVLPEMDKFLRQEVKGLRKGGTVLFSCLHLQKLKEYLARMNFGNISHLIDLKGYSKIRNTGLLLAQALSMDVVIFIDNDEIERLKVPRTNNFREWGDILSLNSSLGTQNRWSTLESFNWRKKS